MLAYDIVNTIALISILLLVVLAYTFRVITRGKAEFSRVNKQGSSVLLGKGMMEMAYWSLQPVARFLVFIGCTPNQLSWASLVLGGLAGTSLAFGYFGFAALFATYSAFLDTLDGMVARLTHVASDAGEVLDAAVDRYVEFFFLAGVVIYYRQIAALQVVALFALAGSFMVSYSTAKAEALHIPPPPGIMRRPERAFYLILGAALSPIPMPWVDALFNFPFNVGYPLLLATFFVAVLSNISAIERLWTIGRAMREREKAAHEGVEISSEEVASESLETDIVITDEKELALSPKKPS